ncbi:MAG: NAD(P)-dependent oxidoreductase [Smithella sp.]
MLVAITGGTGFIGTKLVRRHLEVGDKVRVISRRAKQDIPFRNSVELFSGDITLKSKSTSAFVDGVDILYHCAGEISHPGKIVSTNVEGTEYLSSIAAGKIGHWVQLGSVGVYGTHFNGVVTEDTPLNPLDLYEKTKAMSDDIVEKAGRRGSFTYAILRPSGVFSPSMKNQSLFQMTEMIDKGFFFFIGKPGALMNYIHVDNVVEGLVRCGRMSSAINRIYNLSDCWTIEEFVKIIVDELSRPFPKFRLPKALMQVFSAILGRLPGFPLTESRVRWLTNRSHYSIERINQDLGYVHLVSMEDGLRQMVRKWKQDA